MIEESHVEISSRGDYEFLLAEGEVDFEHYYRAYKACFERRRGAKCIFLLSDLRNLTTVLGPDDFDELLRLTKDYEIGAMIVANVSEDPGRPNHGKMVEAMADGYGIELSISYFDNMAIAHQWLQQHIPPK